MDFTGPGGGPYTLRVAGGACRVIKVRAESADIVLRQRPDTFVKTAFGIQDPMLAMLTGKMKVRGLRKMGTFAKLFPPPRRVGTFTGAAEGMAALR